MNIREALATLDPDTDDHWTVDGMPRMDVIEALVGDTLIVRKQVTDAAPDFTRATAQMGMDLLSVDQDSDETEPYVMDMAFKDIIKSHKHMEAWQVEVSAMTLEWQREHQLLEDRIAHVSRLSVVVATRLRVLAQAKPSADTAAIRAYLGRQAEVRAERARRAQAFIDQGIDQGQLSSLIVGKAKIDMAMNQRKPALGSTRPAPRLPVQDA